jgi:hypothetical protein
VIVPDDCEAEPDAAGFPISRFPQGDGKDDCARATPTPAKTTHMTLSKDRAPLRRMMVDKGLAPLLESAPSTDRGRRHVVLGVTNVIFDLNSQ